MRGNVDDLQPLFIQCRLEGIGARTGKLMFLHCGVRTEFHSALHGRLVTYGLGRRRQSPPGLRHHQPLQRQWAVHATTATPSCPPCIRALALGRAGSRAAEATISQICRTRCCRLQSKPADRTFLRDHEKNRPGTEGRLRLGIQEPDAVINALTVSLGGCSTMPPAVA
jgi:hypothetical protein